MEKNIKDERVKQEIDELIDNMTIEELKAAAKIGLVVTLSMMSKTIEVLKKHLMKKGGPGG